MFGLELGLLFAIWEGMTSLPTHLLNVVLLLSLGCSAELGGEEEGDVVHLPLVVSTDIDTQVVHPVFDFPVHHIDKKHRFIHVIVLWSYTVSPVGMRWIVFHC